MVGNKFLGKQALHDLASSLLSWDGFHFPPLSRCAYSVSNASHEQLVFHIGDRLVTFSVLPGSRIRCVEEHGGFDLRHEGTLQDGWTFSHRYDVP